MQSHYHSLCRKCAYPVSTAVARGTDLIEESPRDRVLRDISAFALDTQAPTIQSFPIGVF